MDEVSDQHQRICRFSSNLSTALFELNEVQIQAIINGMNEVKALGETWKLTVPEEGASGWIDV